MSYSDIILNRSCVADEYLYLFNTQIHIRYEARNRFFIIFKHVIGSTDLICSIVDLFNSCQFHISCTKHVKLFFKVLDQGKSLQLCLPDDMRGGGSKIWHFRGDIIF